MDNVTVYADVLLKLRRDTASNWETINPILLEGEPAIITDSIDSLHMLKIGDGVTAWNDLPFIPGDVDASTKMDKFGEVTVNENENETALRVPDGGLANYKFKISGESGGTFLLESNTGGGTLSYDGPGVLRIDGVEVPVPTRPFDAANKKYVDNAIANIEISGGGGGSRVQMITWEADD